MSIHLNPDEHKTAVTSTQARTCRKAPYNQPKCQAKSAEPAITLQKNHYSNTTACNHNINIPGLGTNNVRGKLCANNSKLPR